MTEWHSEAWYFSNFRESMRIGELKARSELEEEKRKKTEEMVKKKEEKQRLEEERKKQIQIILERDVQLRSFYNNLMRSKSVELG